MRHIHINVFSRCCKIYILKSGYLKAILNFSELREAGDGEEKGRGGGGGGGRWTRQVGCGNCNSCRNRLYGLTHWLILSGS